MLTVDRIMRIAAVVVLTTLAALALPSASGAEQPTISLNNNVESPLLRYRDCVYRVQVGQFGSAAYAQLKLRRSACRTTGVDYSGCFGVNGDYDCKAQARVSVGATGYRVATAHLTAPGPRVIQATIRGGFTVNSASYMICSSTSRGNTCDKGFIRLRSTHPHSPCLALWSRATGESHAEGLAEQARAYVETDNQATIVVNLTYVGKVLTI